MSVGLRGGEAEASQMRFASAFTSRSPTASAPALLGRVLPDVNDRRYPRPTGFAVLRATPSCWWLLGVCNVTVVLTNLPVLTLHKGLQALWEGAHLAFASLLDRVFQVVERQPWVIAPPLATLASVVVAGRWAHAENVHKFIVPALRVFRALTPTPVARGIGHFALRRLWDRSMQIGLFIAAVFSGVANALVVRLPPADPHP